MTETINKMTINRTAEIGIRLMSVICIFPIILCIAVLSLAAAGLNADDYIRYFILTGYLISLAGGIMYIHYYNPKNWIMILPLIFLTTILGCLFLFLPTLSETDILAVSFFFTGWVILLFGKTLPKLHPMRKWVIDTSIVVIILITLFIILGLSFMGNLLLLPIGAVLIFSKFQYPC